MKKMTRMTYLSFQAILRIFDDQSGIFATTKQSMLKSLKTSGISVKQALIINEKKTISAIMKEMKYMLDYKVGHYIKYEDISQSNKKTFYDHSCSLNRSSSQMVIWTS